MKYIQSFETIEACEFFTGFPSVKTNGGNYLFYHPQAPNSYMKYVGIVNLERNEIDLFEDDVMLEYKSSSVQNLAIISNLEEVCGQIDIYKNNRGLYNNK